MRFNQCFCLKAINSEYSYAKIRIKMQLSKYFFIFLHNKLYIYAEERFFRAETG